MAVFKLPLAEIKIRIFKFAILNYIYALHSIAIVTHIMFVPIYQHVVRF